MTKWLKRRILRPIYDFLYRHLCWVEAQGQVFQTKDSVHVQWTENCSSVIEKSRNPKLFRKFRDIPHGSVVFCERIWTPSGFLRDVRGIQVILSQEEILRYNRTGTIDYKPYLTESVATYSRRMGVFDSAYETGK